jgi:hypothetical protein
MTIYEACLPVAFAIVIMAVLLWLAHVWPEIEIRISKERNRK